MAETWLQLSTPHCTTREGPIISSWGFVAARATLIKPLITRMNI
jgi:hypothetical protein